MSKVYVKEVKRKNADGDYLVKVETYTSKPKRYSYLIWI